MKKRKKKALVCQERMSVSYRPGDKVVLKKNTIIKSAISCKVRERGMLQGGRKGGC